MTAQFPNDIYEERDTENLPGIVFDADKKQNLYSEDFQNHAAEIIAIEETLGENPQGAYETVLAWLTDLASSIGGIVTAFIGLSDVPASYEEQAGKILAVNAEEDALEFIDAPTGGGAGLALVASGTFTGSTTLSDLLGDSAGFYKLIIAARRSAGFELRMTFNGDTGTNYNHLRHYYGYAGGSPYTGDARVKNGNYFPFSAGDQKSQLLEITIAPKSGGVRTILDKIIASKDGDDFMYMDGAGHWGNTADELTSITFYPSNTIDAGEYFLYKSQ